MSRLALKRIRAAAIVTTALLLVGVPRFSHATPITTLFSTGVDATGALLAAGSVDPHYVVDNLGINVLGASAFVLPTSAYNGPMSTAQWISPVTSVLPGPGPGPFLYKTTFDLTGFDPALVAIFGAISADNEAVVRLNGVDVYSTVPVAQEPWETIAPFTITSGFISGVNTLEIRVPNNQIFPTTGDGPSGILLDVRAATVPEPSSLILLGTGLAALVRHRRSRRR